MIRSAVFQVRCSPEEKARWVAAANRRGVRLSEFTRMLLDGLDADGTGGVRVGKASFRPDPKGRVVRPDPRRK